MRGSGKEKVKKALDGRGKLMEKARRSTVYRGNRRGGHRMHREGKRGKRKREVEGKKKREDRGREGK